MNHRSTMFLIAAAAVAVAVGFSAGGWAKSRRSTKNRKLVAIPPSAQKWEEFYPGGPLEAFVVGAKTGPGPTAFFIRFKAGFDSGWHTHDSDYTGIVMSGTIVETSKGSGPAAELPVGSYYMQPGKPVVHRTECTKAADCLVYIYEKGGFSFTPTTEDGTPVATDDPRARAKQMIEGK